MSKMAEKAGGQSKQASGSKAETAGGKSVGRSHENVAFTLAAGSIGLAVTLLEQERAEAATNLTHEGSHDQAASDLSAAVEGESSGGDNLLTANATASDGPQGAVRVAISEAAGTLAEVAAPVNIEAANNVIAADHQEAPAASEASQTLSQAHTAMSSSDISQDVVVHQSAGSGTISIPAGVTPVTPHSPAVSQNDPVDWSVHVEHGAETVQPNTVVDDGVLAPIGEVISDVGGAVGDVVSGVGDLVGDLLGGGNGKGVLSDLGSTVGDVVGAVGDVVSGVGDLVGGLLGSGDGKGLLSGLGSVAENAMDTVGNLVSGAGSTVGDVVGTVSNVVSGVGSAVGDVVDTVGSVVSGVGDLLGGLLGGGKDGPVDVGSTVENVAETVGDAASSVGSTVGGTLDTVGDAVSGVGSVVDGVLGTVSGAVSGIGGLVGGLLGGLASTEQDSQETAATTAANMFDAASGALQFSDEPFGILTPTLSFLGQSMFVPNDPMDLSNHHGTMLHGLTWEG